MPALTTEASTRKTLDSEMSDLAPAQIWSRSSGVCSSRPTCPRAVSSRSGRRQAERGLHDHHHGACHGAAADFHDQPLPASSNGGGHGSGPDLDELASRYEHLYPIASRCGVFANTLDSSAVRGSGKSGASRKHWLTK